MVYVSPPAPPVTKPVVGEALEKFVPVTGNIISLYFNTYIYDYKSWNANEEDDQAWDDLFTSRA